MLQQIKPFILKAGTLRGIISPVAQISLTVFHIVVSYARRKVACERLGSGIGEGRVHGVVQVSIVNNIT